jgi:AcrR family transcriptional regulator
MTSGLSPKSEQRPPKAGTRDKILDAAEIEFSAHGFEACSLRMISAAHDINLGLIHYYFGGKEGLFSEVFLRRSKTLVIRRQTLLREARRRHGKKSLPVEEIIHGFIAPTVEMIKQGEGPRAYIRLQGLVRSDPSDFARKLRGEAFNETNDRYIRELQRSCPHLPPASVVWRFSAMVGAFYSLISQSARVNELSDGLCDSNDIDAAFAEAIPFIVGGFVAPKRNAVERTQSRSAAQRPGRRQAKLTSRQVER